MKVLEGTIYTNQLLQLVSTLEEAGLVVHKICRDGRGIWRTRISEGIAHICDHFNRVKIRTLVQDDMVAPLMEILRGFGDCKLSICSETQMAFA